MRITGSIRVLAVIVVILLSGCAGGSSNSAIARPPADYLPQAIRNSTMQGLVAAMSEPGLAKSGYRGASYNTCPATGQIEYISDFHDLTVDIFAGDFAGQAPCGVLTGFTQPAGLFVRSGNLYVSDDLGEEVFAFHRGATTPFTTYRDRHCGGDRELDVAVSDDGFLYATSLGQMETCQGSISVWNRASGKLVGNYPLLNPTYPEYLTIQTNGTLYVVDSPLLLVSTCKKGQCGTFKEAVAGALVYNGVRSIDNDINLVFAEAYSPGGSLITYTLPKLNDGPTGVCQFDLNSPNSIAFNASEHHVFVTDPVLGIASEQKYPRDGGHGGACGVIGTVETTGRLPVGIAVDPPEPN